MLTDIPGRLRGMFALRLRMDVRNNATLLVAALGIGLLACTSPDSAGAPAGADDAATATPLTHTPTATTPHDIMVLDNYCGIPDPAIDESYATRTFLNLPLVTEIHAGLFEYDESGAPTLVPNLAETYAVSDDGTTYEFRLRKDLRFSDGTALTASDVKWSWGRALSLSSPGSRGRDAFGTIQGAVQLLEGTSLELAGVKVIDDRTLSVQLEARFPDFPMLLATPASFVLKRENVESWPMRWANETTSAGIIALFDDAHADQHWYEDFGEANLPVGAGPFKLTKLEHYDIGATCSFARNDHHWAEPPTLDAVQFGVDVDAYSVGELERATDPGGLFRSGQVDAQLVLSNESLQDEYAQIADASGGKTLSMNAPHYTLFLAFDTGIPPFDDVHFRRALVHATELDSVFEVPVRWQPQIVPPRMLSREKTITPLPDDDELALAELDRSPYSDQIGRFRFVMYTDGTTIHLDRLERLFDLWEEKLGLQIEIEILDSPDTVEEQMQANPFPITQFEIEPYAPHPHTVLGVLDAFGESVERRDSDWITVTEHLQAVKTVTDPARRQRLYDELEQGILDDALALPLLVDWTDFQILVQPWVHGFNLKRFGGSVFHKVWFDDTAPERPLP